MQTAALVPASAPLRRDGAHLAADQAYAAAVEPSTQVQIGVFLTVPGADHDPPVEAGDGDSLIERQGVAGELVGQAAPGHSAPPAGLLARALAHHPRWRRDWHAPPAHGSAPGGRDRHRR